jgi:archaeal chaperonin
METILVNGVVIDKTIDNSAMPRVVENAKVLLIDEELEGKRTRIDAEITIDSPHQMQSFLDKEHLLTTSKVRSIIRSGANVVISQKGINALAQNHLSRAGIVSVKRVTENDMLWLKKATNAKVIRDLNSGVIPIEYHFIISYKFFTNLISMSKILHGDDPTAEISDHLGIGCLF